MTKSPTPTLVGTVVTHEWAPGSKSAHTAVCLKTKDGALLRLRRLGGNPFQDPELDVLVGHTIRAMGHVVNGSVLIMSSHEIVHPPNP